MDLEANSVPMQAPRELRGGYASLSAFLAGTRAFQIYRRFDTLAARNLLYMQDELCEIEGQIDDLDMADMTSEYPVDQYSLHSRRFDRNERRVELMKKSAKLLRSYGTSCRWIAQGTLDSPQMI
jgi:hypothetical protein